MQIGLDARPSLLEVVVAQLRVEPLHHFERTLHQLVVAHVDQLMARDALFLFEVVAHHRFVEMQHGVVELGMRDALKSRKRQDLAVQIASGAEYVVGIPVNVNELRGCEQLEEQAHARGVDRILQHQALAAGVQAGDLQDT